MTSAPESRFRSVDLRAMNTLTNDDGRIVQVGQKWNGSSIGNGIDASEFDIQPYL